MALGFAGTAFFFIVSFLEGLYSDLLYISGFAVIFIGFYLLGRFKERPIKWPAIAILNIIAAFAWLFNGGIQGVYVVIYLSMMLCFLIILPRTEHMILYILSAITTILLFVAEYFFPQLVQYNDLSSNVIYIDYAITYFTMMTTMFMMFSVFKSNYENERYSNQMQKEKLANLSIQKDNFYINLSHELKTPLTLISNYLDSYINKNGTQKELEIMSANLNKLQRDVINLLDTEKLQRGIVLYNHDCITDISGAVNEVLTMFSEYALKKEIKIESNIEEGLYVKADPSAIDRIINNLLDNAIKYTRQKGIILVRLIQVNGKMLILVKDNGFGIPQHDQPHIFEPYYQAYNIKENKQGIGMGLFIIKSIVEELQGSISFKSVENIGTEFIVTLPVYAAGKDDKIITPSITTKRKTPESHIIAISEPIHDHGRPTILLIDDVPDMLEFLNNELSLDYNTYCASSGNEALQKLKTVPKPDIIISDVMMDEMDGIELFDRIRNNPEFQHIPVIFLTARTKENDKMLALERGAFDYIYKPFRLPELKSKIQTVVGYTTKQRNHIVKNMVESLQAQMPYTNITESKPIQKTLLDLMQKHNITPREQDVLQLIKQGKTYEDIGKELHISDKTVIRHVQNMFEKTGVHTKIDLINVLFA